MSKFKVTYKRPARQRVRLVEAITPEDAAASTRREQGDDIEGVEVQEVGEEDVFSVYQWCSVCGLPVWLDDDITTYRTITVDNDSEATVAHVTCINGDSIK